MEAQKVDSSETTDLPGLIAWAKSVGIHPSLIGSLEESASQASLVETRHYLQEAQVCLARAQECFSKGDRANSDYWELMVYEAIQKVSLKRG